MICLKYFLEFSDFIPNYNFYVSIMLVLCFNLNNTGDLAWQNRTYVHKIHPFTFFTDLIFCISYTSSVNCIKQCTVCCASCQSFIDKSCLGTKVWNFKRVINFYVHIALFHTRSQNVLLEYLWIVCWNFNIILNDQFRVVKLFNFAWLLCLMFH